MTHLFGAGCEGLSNAEQCSANYCRDSHPRAVSATAGFIVASFQQRRSPMSWMGVGRMVTNGGAAGRDTDRAEFEDRPLTTTGFDLIARAIPFAAQSSLGQPPRRAARVEEGPGSMARTPRLRPVHHVCEGGVCAMSLHENEVR
jgi:hypothetical protein